MKKYVVANWKSHKTMPEVERWVERFCKIFRPDPQMKVIIAPPVVYIPTLWRLLQDQGAAHLSLAVQDLSPFPLGNYTGAIAAEMVRGMVDYAMVGHSERRRYFHETDQEIANKVMEAAAAGITPILCLDQPYIRSQLAALGEDVPDLIIGYGPVEAIGIDLPQSSEKTARAIQDIQGIVPDNPILYGGSVNSENAGNYMKIPGVSGLMAGSASLGAGEFAAVCEVVARA